MRRAIDSFGQPVKDTSAENLLKKDNLLKSLGNLFEVLKANTLTSRQSEHKFNKAVSTQTSSGDFDAIWKTNAEKNMFGLDNPNKILEKTVFREDLKVHEDELPSKILYQSTELGRSNSKEMAFGLSLKVTSPLSRPKFIRKYEKERKF